MGRRSGRWFGRRSGVAEPTAVVIGASMAGRCAAAALARSGVAVTVLERDRLPERPESRRGVPQDTQAHVLLYRGLTVIEDLLSNKEGLEVGERQVRADEVGRAPDDVKGEAVIAVVRNKTLRRFYDPTVAKLETGDQVVVVRHAEAEVAEGEQPPPPTRRRPSRRDDW